jgi:hypothetical protein
MLERIQAVLDYYLQKGVNKEKINELYFKILTLINKK